MNALLRSLRARGIAVRLNGDKVNVSPASLLTDADRNRIRANKSVIVAILAGTAVTVRSRLLGEDVRVVEALDGPAAVPVETGPATYCRAEVERMLGLDADEVQAIHTLKRHFGGEHLGLASPEDAASVEQMPPADHGTQCRADPSAKTAPTAEEVGEPEVLAQLAVESYPIGSRVWVRHRALSQGEPEWRQATVLRVWGAVDDPYLTPPELAGQVMVQVDGMEAETLLSVCQLFRDRKEIERCT